MKKKGEKRIKMVTLEIRTLENALKKKYPTLSGDALSDIVNEYLAEGCVSGDTLDPETIDEINGISDNGQDIMGLGYNRIIFHEPATVVYWDDGTKTVVKAKTGTDEFSPEAGVLLCFLKHACGDDPVKFHKVLKDLTAGYRPATHAKKSEKKETGKPKKAAISKTAAHTADKVKKIG